MTRLLDFGDISPFAGIFGRPRNLAWPVNAYRITIPSIGHHDDGLNPFERVVVGILRAEPAVSDANIAETTCIPVDLVRAVTLRLRDKGLIDVDNRPTQVVPTPRFAQDHGLQAVTAMVFQDPISGRLLPFVFDPSQRKLKDREDWEVRTVRVPREANRLAAPTPGDVLAALRQAQRRSTGASGALRLPASSQIHVAPDAETVFLDCPIAIQRSDAEFRIADPFGNGYSRALEESFTTLLNSDEQLQEWMTEWRSSLSRHVDETADETKRTRQPFEDDVIRRRYPKLVASLTPGRKLGVRTTEKVYAALEWALFYCADLRYGKVATEVLRATPAADWAAVLTLVAETVGLSTPQHGFRTVPPGRLDDFLDGKAEMSTLVAVLLVQAANDPQHPLRLVAKKVPDFLLQIDEIKTIRDGRAHGEGVVANAESRFDPMLRECVTLLLPDVRFSDTPAARRSGSSLDESLLEARTALLGVLGYKLINALGVSASDHLLDAEQHWLSHQDGDDALPLVTALTASLQAVMRELLAGATSLGLAEREYLVTASKAAADAGLGQLPDSLRTVRPARIREAMQGNGSTLGACVVAYLLVSGADRLSMLADTQPSLLRDIDTVLRRRGHGNDAIPLSRPEAKQLRAATLKSIRTLLEA